MYIGTVSLPWRRAWHRCLGAGLGNAMLKGLVIRNKFRHAKLFFRVLQLFCRVTCCLWNACRLQVTTVVHLVLWYIGTISLPWRRAWQCPGEGLSLPCRRAWQCPEEGPLWFETNSYIQILFFRVLQLFCRVACCLCSSPNYIYESCNVDMQTLLQGHTLLQGVSTV